MAENPDPLNDLRDAPRLARIYQALAALYRRAGDTTRADDFQARRLDLWRRWDRKLPGNVFIRSQLEAAARP